ncbi:Protein shuttle craft [Trachymyrmex septentrionalis]|uniref:Protein shuttle craft n=1 Tax=Trachymyrmex septentrionalis TaxID=34720 RepID=A0A195FUE9_9HYME|nr:PREDICTED: protein shuttle craft [Trachymyrmex septentrionalis]KYN44046.1 Protein shuttle craft [Trachymyrmex septentrionalis]
MATWNGSYSEDLNCLAYDDRNAADVPATAGNWPYFVENNAYLGDVPHVSTGGYYPRARGGRQVYEQSGPTTAYYQDGSQYPSNMVPLKNNAYQERVLPNTLFEDNAGASNSGVPTSHNAPPFSRGGYRPRSRGNRTAGKYAPLSAGDVVQSTVVENSNLHPIANEFVPNNQGRFRKDNRFKKYDNGNPSGFNTFTQEFRPKSASSDNKGERRYDNRRDANYRQKKPQDMQASSRFGYRDTPKTYNARNYNKFQNSKYYNRKYQSNVPPTGQNATREARTTMTEAIDSAMSSSQENKTFGEDVQEDDSSSSTKIDRSREEMLMHVDNNSENMFSRSQEASRNGRVKRFASASNYRYNSNDMQSESGTSRKTTAAKYIQRRNNEMINYKEKKMANWRDKTESNETVHASQGKNYKKKYDIDDDSSQRERLTEQLNKGTLECLVCYEHIKQSDYVWSCSNCYHVLHLKCIKKWAKSSQSENNSWKCPACRDVSFLVPEDYFCFCGKMKMPEWNRRDVAHSCGEICGRHLSKNNCMHKCILLCHPGSCPQCVAMVTKYCGCGRTSKMLLCSIQQRLICDSVCEKDLSCGKHTCQKKCHQGECGPCDKIVQQTCFCSKKTQEVPCRVNVADKFSCDNICNKTLDCKKHYCQKICHPGACEPCSLTPERVTMCCCGQTPLTEKRESCMDPVPTCDKICSKRLRCGQPNNPHICKAPCHLGECPECDLNTDVKCRCGNMDREIACKDLTSKADDARCEKRCKKKRTCGKHNCNQLCCIDIEHICPLPCSKTLSCGRHKCQERCHIGRCSPCLESSFEELYCECGAEVIYPPVPCGTRRPICNRPCSREHLCNHEVLHNCHSESTCPPCSVLTQRWCHGKHELRKAVPCHVKEISCGLPCNKPLTCGRHKCITMCHAGSCEKPGQQCIQPCTTMRELCGHICAAPCHEGKCPDMPCKEMVKVTCQCGHRTMSRVCADNAREYQRIASNILASKMADMQLGHSVDLEEVFGQGAKKQNQLKTLECNDECKTIERNRRLALGLQIANPDLSGKLMPRYSDYMKQWAKKDPHFCQIVHDKLTELVQLAKTSKQKSRSYSFEVMNREKRHFVHESCQHFGCESQAYDEEPKRNVVATAVKDKCWLPSYSLLEMIQREKGQRKVPGPVLNTSKGNNSTKTVLSLPVKQNQQLLPSTPKTADKEIDYFDYRD